MIYINTPIVCQNKGKMRTFISIYIIFIETGNLMVNGYKL